MINQSTAPYGVLILRVSLGIVMLAHGALKILGFGLPGTVAYFASLGVPAIMAYGVMALEIVGGVCLILGVYVRWFALAFAVEMLGTIVLVHGHNGWVFANKGGGWEYPAFLTAALLSLYLLGDGALALRPAIQRN